MGLPICRSIVTVHGGRIWAENNSDGGARVSFTLPTGQENTEHGRRTDRSGVDREVGTANRSVE